jgi:hypothetical protein
MTHGPRFVEKKKNVVVLVLHSINGHCEIKAVLVERKKKNLEGGKQLIPLWCCAPPQS